MPEVRARLVAWAVALLAVSLLGLSLTGDGSGTPRFGLLRGAVWVWVLLGVLCAGVVLAWDLERRARPREVRRHGSP